METLRYYLLCCASLLVLGACTGDNTDEPKSKHWIGNIEASEEDDPPGRYREPLNEASLKAWLDEGLAPQDERGMAMPYNRLQYGSSPWRYMGLSYIATKDSPQPKHGLTRALQIGFKPELFKEGSTHKNDYRMILQSYRDFKLKGIGLRFVRERQEYRGWTYDADREIFLSNYNREALEHAVYNSSISEFVKVHGTHILGAYSFGMAAELNYCRVPKQLEEQRRTDAEVAKVLDLLDKEPEMQTFLKANGDRVYYYFRTTGVPRPVFSWAELLRRHDNGSKYHKWYIDAMKGGQDLLLGSEKFYDIKHFVQEHNFKYLIDQFTTGDLPETLQKPFIRIGKVEVGTKAGKPFYDLVPVLYTRHGTRVVLAEVLNPDEFVIATRGGEVDMPRYVERVEAYMNNAEAYAERMKALQERCRQAFALELRLQHYGKPEILKMSEAESRESSLYAFPLYNHLDQPYTIKQFSQGKTLYLSSPHRDVMLCYLLGAEGGYIDQKYGISAWVQTLPKAEDREGFTLVGL